MNQQYPTRNQSNGCLMTGAFAAVVIVALILMSMLASGGLERSIQAWADARTQEVEDEHLHVVNELTAPKVAEEIIAQKELEIAILKAQMAQVEAQSQADQTVIQANAQLEIERASLISNAATIVVYLAIVLALLLTSFYAWRRIMLATADRRVVALPATAQEGVSRPQTQPAQSVRLTPLYLRRRSDQRHERESRPVHISSNNGSNGSHGYPTVVTYEEIGDEWIVTYHSN